MENFLFVDLQGFKNYKNQFIVKEFALAMPEYTQTFLIKPPYNFLKLRSDERKQVEWIENNRGILWSEGYIDYREFRRIIKPVLFKQNVFVKGQEKVKWVRELCDSCNIVDLGEKGYPNFSKLYKKYIKDNVKLNCFAHQNHCALKNVICVRNWFYDNNMYLFKFFT